jgi:hypothetical protein
MPALASAPKEEAAAAADQTWLALAVKTSELEAAVVVAAAVVHPPSPNA